MRYSNSSHCAQHPSARRHLLSASVVTALATAALPLLASPALADGPPCQQATGTGLTAKIVAVTGQHVTGPVDAAGCDIGVYIGSGTTHVVINSARITGANDHGVLVQDSNNDVITNTEVTGTGAVHSDDLGGEIAEDKAIELVGASHVTVTHNRVHDNAGGGIGVSDDGPVNPGALQAGSSLPAVNNLIAANAVSGNTYGCGIVVAAYNTGAGVVANKVEHNSVTTSPAGIVIATDALHSSATGNKVIGNTSTLNGLPGIIVHSNAPGDRLNNTQVSGNTVSGNGALIPGGPMASGIALIGAVEPVGPATVTGNRISDEKNGISEANAPDVRAHGNTFHNVGTDIFVF